MSEIPYASIFNDCPKDWRVVPLQEHVYFQEGPGIMAVDFRESGIPLMRLAGIGEKYATLEKCNFLDPEKVKKKWDHFRLELGDIVTTTSASIGRTSVINEATVGAIPYTGIVRFKPKTSEITGEYIGFFLRSSFFAQQAESFSAGSVLKHFGPTHLKQMAIAIPPLAEQKSIATVLSSLDDKIDLLHRQNKTIEAMAETLFRQWFVEEAGEDWPTVKVGDFVKTNESTASSSYSHPFIEYLDTSSLTEGKIEEIQLLSFKEAPSRARRLVKHNDILISTVRPNQKHYGIIKNPKENLVVSTGFCVLTCKSIDPYFIYVLLTTDEMTEYLHSIAEGSTTTYPSLKPSDIEKIEFLLPPKKLLDEFASLAKSNWNKIEVNYRQIATLENLRDNLLPKLMSGEVGVG